MTLYYWFVHEGIENPSTKGGTVEFTKEKNAFTFH